MQASLRAGLSRHFPAVVPVFAYPVPKAVKLEEVYTCEEEACTVWLSNATAARNELIDCLKGSPSPDQVITACEKYFPHLFALQACTAANPDLPTTKEEFSWR
eukprot:CAMPEP_0177668744 /NCGR_PEP_ID=MMETSP0447-20121125/22974_1 /TAXON_ID=0 /ORGANISM="Stygamoeba regulata, Strain BSH-02190019" /LENGTH=102 /DNA_ID=CAMNT_0019175371 /DNA_START=60 /DNA_END=365 /DNA_ORIENTATION=+